MSLLVRRKPLSARVAVLGVGHHTYWKQFQGLREKLLEKKSVFIRKLESHSVQVEDFGLVDDAASAYGACPRIVAAQPDVLFVDMLTYATSSTFGVLAREVSCPIVLVALQPDRAMDYAHASTYVQLMNDDFCSVPEFTGVAARMGRKPPAVIVGTLENDPIADAEIAGWCGIARVLQSLHGSRIGHLGHVLEAMLDMHTDPTAATGTFGCHVAQLEPASLVRFFEEAETDAIREKERQILDFFDQPDPVSDPITSKLRPEDLQTAARAAVALDRLIEAYDLDGLAYYYEGEDGSPTRRVMSSLAVGSSLLTAAGVPVAGEFDIKTCLAMLTMDRLEMGG
ncbi:arabinose isomerase, partial [bacterium]|nr:arabinose isomerase [bacterium]